MPMLSSLNVFVFLVQTTISHISFQPTVLRSLSVRMVLTVKCAKFRFFPADFLSLFVPLFWGCWRPAPLRCVWSAAKSLSGVSPANRTCKNELHFKERQRQRMTPWLRECTQRMSAGHGKISFVLRSRPVQT